jgi:SET domain-containing protein
MDEQIKAFIDSEDSESLNRILIKKRDLIPKLQKKQKEKKPNKTILFDSNTVKIAVKPSSIHRYGVFALEKINANSVIETCFLIELEFRDKYHKDKTILDYCYTLAHQKDEENKNHGNKLFFLTGLGMIYNHSKDFNAKWILSEDNANMILIALENIEKNKEITIDYGQGYWNRKNYESKY